jgi:hypothetical protein
LERFSSSAIELWRKDIIEERAAITLRLNVSAISRHARLPRARFTLRWNRAPQKAAPLRAQMQYFKLESEM